MMVGIMQQENVESYPKSGSKLYKLWLMPIKYPILIDTKYRKYVFLLTTSTFTTLIIWDVFGVHSWKQ